MVDRVKQQFNGAWTIQFVNARPGKLALIDGEGNARCLCSLIVMYDIF